MFWKAYRIFAAIVLILAAAFSAYLLTFEVADFDAKLLIAPGCLLFLAILILWPRSNRTKPN